MDNPPLEKGDEFLLPFVKPACPAYRQAGGRQGRWGGII